MWKEYQLRLRSVAWDNRSYGQSSEKTLSHYWDRQKEVKELNDIDLASWGIMNSEFKKKMKERTNYTN